jgi:hypothetical protein
MTLRHKLSTPPTTTASLSPHASQRVALAKTFALDEQAVLIVMAGPVMPSCRATNAEVECG